MGRRASLRLFVFCDDDGGGMLVETGDMGLFGGVTANFGGDCVLIKMDPAVIEIGFSVKSILLWLTRISLY
jgi:hypothetical protein